MGFFARLFGGGGGGTLTVDELARRLGTPVEALRAVRPAYREFDVPKRSGGARRLAAPEPALKTLQCRILRRALGRLKAHPAANGFERGRSIVTNALPHVGKAVVVRMDLKDFFPATAAKRVGAYFRKVGWNAEAADLLVRLCTHRGGLPQGAPTSPRLSNLVNGRMDARLAALAKVFRAAYTRYADDMTFSFAEDDPRAIHAVVRMTKRIMDDEGYELHLREKLQIRRRHEQQRVTGLVVNARPNLPRRTRRWLRAAAYRAGGGGDKEPTLTPAQLVGWRSLQYMIGKQAGGGAAGGGR